MACELYCLKISCLEGGKEIISKSHVGLGDIVDVFEKHGKKNLEGGGKYPCGLGLTSCRENGSLLILPCTQPGYETLCGNFLFIESFLQDLAGCNLIIRFKIVL